jgi:hypothetical protein
MKSLARLLFVSSLLSAAFSMPVIAEDQSTVHPEAAPP